MYVHITLNRVRTSIDEIILCSGRTAGDNNKIFMRVTRIRISYLLRRLCVYSNERITIATTVRLEIISFVEFQRTPRAVLFILLIYSVVRRTGVG